MVHAAEENKLMGSLFNVIRAIIDIMPEDAKPLALHYSSLQSLLRFSI